jgi:hypothetical protein
MENRYFVGILPNSEMSAVYKVIVGYPNQQSIIDNGKKIVVKLPLGETDIPPALNSFQEISHAEAMELTTDNSQLTPKGA